MTKFLEVSFYQAAINVAGGLEVLLERQIWGLFTEELLKGTSWTAQGILM